MATIRIIDATGNQQDFKMQFVPRIGERIVLNYGRGAESAKPLYLRVHEVLHNVDNPPESQVSIYVSEDDGSTLAP